MVPVTGPWIPDRLAWSVTFAPKSAFETLESVVRSGGTQVSSEPRAKSLSWASTSWDERVSARNVLKHGASPPKRVLRLMPPSKNWPSAKLWSPSLLVNDHGAVSVWALTTAETCNAPSGVLTSHAVPAATRVTLSPMSQPILLLSMFVSAPGGFHS